MQPIVGPSAFRWVQTPWIRRSSRGSQCDQQWPHRTLKKCACWGFPSLWGPRGNGSKGFERRKYKYVSSVWKGEILFKNPSSLSINSFDYIIHAVRKNIQPSGLRQLDHSREDNVKPTRKTTTFLPKKLLYFCMNKCQTWSFIQQIKAQMYQLTE